MRCALVVMARYPRIGEGKTRLAKAIGAEQAHRLYCAFLQDIDARFAAAGRTLVWVVHPLEPDFATLVGSTARCMPQRGRDLGERMWDCVQQLCGEGFERVIMIGADVPHVRSEWLDEAEEQLNTADIVLGPTDDGGYYLVAMRAPHDVFTGIPMSTDRVLTETLSRVEALGLRLHLLPCGFDIDEQRDLVRLQTLLRTEGDSVRLPRTAWILESMCGDLVAT